MSKVILHGKPAREKLLKGVDFLADAVKITEGPRGQNCILGQRLLGQTPKVTRDGVTVSNYSDPDDAVEQMGADLVREAAQKTDNAVGDGTTATVVLAQSMIHSGFDLLDKDANPLAIERGIRKAVEVIISRLKSMAIDADEEKIFNVATVSAHGDVEIGRLVADAIKSAGRDGIVTAEPSTNADTKVEHAPGIELEKSGLLHQVFITNPEAVTAEYRDCHVLLFEGIIATAKSVVNILKTVHEKNEPLLIVAGGYEQEALSCIINNKAKLALPIIAVRMEHYGETRREVMRDIAALCGGKAYTEDMGIKFESIQLADLGMARKVVTNFAKTQIIDGKGTQTELVSRVNSVKQQIEQADPGTKTLLRKRLAALLGGITLIKVGGITVTEMEERKDRVVDAISTGRAAIESGVLPGGGAALLHASEILKSLKVSKDEQRGVEIVREACRAVAKQIALNAGEDGGSIVAKLLELGPQFGYNAFTGEFENLIRSGIVDSTNVVVEALKNSAAVACSILTAGAVVAEKLTEMVKQ